jgi:hypothetical protein
MSTVRRPVGRHVVEFSDHALDRWWERQQSEDGCGRQEAIRRLDAALAASRKDRDAPPWADLSLWHRARAEFFLHTSDGAFVVNRNANRDLVAVTYLRPRPARLRPRPRPVGELAAAA